MSTFDPSTFLDATTTEALVRRPPLSVGDYTGVIRDITDIKEGVVSKGPREGQKWVMVQVPIEVEVPADEQVRLGLSTSSLTIRDSIMLDVTPQNTLDNGPGKNGKLRRYRDAVGKNNPGEAFNIRMLAGAPIRVKIGQEEYPEGSGELVERVESVSKL